MAKINAGSNATLSLSAGDVVSVSSGGGLLRVEIPTGTVAYEGDGVEQTFGPYPSTKSVTITSLIGGIDYTVSTPPGQQAAFVPSNVAITGGSIGVPGTIAFNDATAATTNVVAINAALAAGNDVALLTPGTLWINAPLIIQNGTRLRVGKSTTIKLASGSNCTMLKPAAFDTTGALQKSVTLTWTSGLACQVTFSSAHGLTREDYLWIQGANQTEYNNVFRVVNVIDSTNVLVLLRRTPQAAATGSPVAQPCTRGFTIEGGVWDYNAAGNPSGTGYNKDCWALMAAANFRASDASFNYLHRAVTTGALADYEISGMSYRTDLTNAAEAHKTYGPINGGKVRNITAISSDDGMSVQPKEAVAFGWTGIPFGDIFDLTFEDCRVRSYGNAAGGAFPLYMSDSETVDNLTYRNCAGFSDQGSAFVIKYGDLYTTGKFGQIRYEHCTGAIGATAATGGQYPFSAAAGGDRLSFIGFQPQAADTTGTHYMMRIQSGVTINEVDIEAKFSNASFAASGGTFMVVSGVVNALRLANSHLVANTNTNWIAVNGTVYNVSADNCNVGASAGFLAVNSGGTIYNAAIRGSNFNGCGYGVLATSTGTPCNISLHNNTFQNMAIGVVRPNTGTGVVCRVYGGGNFFSSAAPVNAGGSATFEMHSFDIPINVGQTGAIKTVAGQYAFNTTANGTLAANRLVTCNGTNWIQVDTPANVF